MKRYLNIINACLVFVFFGINAQAQSTALSPSEGALHTYQWTGLAPGDSYEFYMTDDASLTSAPLDDATVADFDFESVLTGVVSTTGVISLDIQWNVGSATKDFYLWLDLTANASGCVNRTYIRILPQGNSFDVLAENVPVTNLESCPDLDNNFNPVMGTEDAGLSRLSFKVRRLNGTTTTEGGVYDWSFEANLSSSPVWENELAIESVRSAGGVITPAGDRFIVQGEYDEVIVTILIKNLEGSTQVVEMLLENIRESVTNLVDKNGMNNLVRHRIKMNTPISSMGGV